jgi:TonB family protein
MRRMILASLVLLPVMAHAQASSSARSKTSNFAELAVPAAPATAGLSSALALTPSSGSGAVHESIHTQSVDDFASTRAFDPIARSQASGPSVKAASSFGLVPQDLAHAPAVIKVVVDARIDANGVPHNISVSHSAGKLIDDKAIAAVSQYRFKPALLDNRPTESAVSIAIQIQKQ